MATMMKRADQRADQLGDGRALLAHAHVDAHEIVLLGLGLLVDDRVDREASLTVTFPTRRFLSCISPSH